MLVHDLVHEHDEGSLYMVKRMLYIFCRYRLLYVLHNMPGASGDRAVNVNLIISFLQLKIFYQSCCRYNVSIDGPGSFWWCRKRKLFLTVVR